MFTNFLYFLHSLDIDFISGFWSLYLVFFLCFQLVFICAHFNFFISSYGLCSCLSFDTG